MKKKNLLPIVLCIAFAALARTVGVVYSALATNVLYQTSVICNILPVVRQILTAMSMAAAVGGIMGAFTEDRSGKAHVITYAAVIVADGVFVILFDLFTGIFAGDTASLIMGIGVRIGNCLYCFAMLLLGCAIAKAMLRRGGALRISVAVAATLVPAVDLITVMWTVITSLFEWDFMPYTSEIYSMALDIGTVILSGVASVAVAILLAEKKKS